MARVFVQDGKFEQAMRKFKNKVKDEGKMEELRDRECYVKPSIERKKAKAQARKRWLKKLESDQLPKKLY